VPALLQSQAYVVDLIAAYDDLASLIPQSSEEKPPYVRIIEKPQRTLRFTPVIMERGPAASLPVLGPQAALRSGSACHRMNLGSVVSGCGCRLR